MLVGSVFGSCGGLRAYQSMPGPSQGRGLAMHDMLHAYQERSSLVVQPDPFPGFLIDRLDIISCVILTGPAAEVQERLREGARLLWTGHDTGFGRAGI